MEKNNTYTIIFAIIICLLSSSLLTLVSRGLHERKELNKKIDRQKNILKVFGYDLEEMKQKAIVETYKNSIEEKFIENNKEELIIYRSLKKGKVDAFAIPIKGYGLWSWLYGYLALEKDLKTIRGITFYEHNETPGLGGEISSDWFQKNFIGKKICSSEGALTGIKVVKGKAQEIIQDPEELSHCVDGISGATITSQAVTKIIKAELNKYFPYFKQWRKA